MRRIASPSQTKFWLRFSTMPRRVCVSCKKKSGLPCETRLFVFCLFFFFLVPKFSPGVLPGSTNRGHKTGATGARPLIRWSTGPQPAVVKPRVLGVGAGPADRRPYSPGLVYTMPGSRSSRRTVALRRGLIRSAHRAKPISPCQPQPCGPRPTTTRPPKTRTGRSPVRGSSLLTGRY